MTNEEAIRILDNLKPTKQYDENDAYYIGQALTMAIQALSQEPCEDTISREDARMMLTCEIKDGMTITKYIEMVDKRLRKLPPVTPKEKTGHWIDDMRLGYHVSVCSNCNWRGHGDTCLIYEPKYCPNCGARMESET